MPQTEQFEVLVLGSGAGGKLVAWHMARSGRRTAVVERRWIGGSCPNIACMPSKNEISSARVAHLARSAAQIGTINGPLTIDMRQRPGGIEAGNIWKGRVRSQVEEDCVRRNDAGVSVIQGHLERSRPRETPSSHDQFRTACLV